MAIRAIKTEPSVAETWIPELGDGAGAVLIAEDAGEVPVSEPGGKAIDGGDGGIWCMCIDITSTSNRWPCLQWSVSPLMK